MSEIQKEALGTPKNLGELMEQYKQIEQAFNARIVEIVENSLPHDFDMVQVNGLDRVFQELNSPQNLRKEGVVSINLDMYSEDQMGGIFYDLMNAFDKRVYDRTIVSNIVITRFGGPRCNLYFSILPENIEIHTIEIVVSDTVSGTVALVDGVLSQ